jgi:hypothetical protein
MYYRLKLYYNTLGTFEPIGELTICSKGHIQSTIRKFSKKNTYLQLLFKPFLKIPSTLKVIID